MLRLLEHSRASSPWHAGADFGELARARPGESGFHLDGSAQVGRVGATDAAREVDLGVNGRVYAATSCPSRALRSCGPRQQRVRLGSLAAGIRVRGRRLGAHCVAGLRASRMAWGLAMSSTVPGAVGASPRLGRRRRWAWAGQGRAWAGQGGARQSREGLGSGQPRARTLCQELRSLRTKARRRLDGLKHIQRVRLQRGEGPGSSAGRLRRVGLK